MTICVKKEVYKQCSFLVAEQVLCICCCGVWFGLVFLNCSVCHHFTPALGTALLWLDPACSCWLMPQKNLSVQARRENLCMDQTCSRLPDTVHMLVSLLTWKENAGLVIIPGLTNLQASHTLMLSKGNDF